jgi:hypothetical protein
LCGGRQPITRASDGHVSVQQPRARPPNGLPPPGHRPAPTGRRRSPLRTHTPRINTNHPPPVCTFLLPLSFLVLLFRSRNRVLESIEIALPTPQIVQRRRLSELPVLFPARRVVRFPDRAALVFSGCRRAGGGGRPWIGSSLAC